jgi:cytochrome c5
VSKHDTHFFNIFSVVLGMLVAFAILMFAFARYLGVHTQLAQVTADPLYQAAVQERTAPPVRIAVAGADNSAMAIKAPVGQAAAVVMAMPKTGPELFEMACKACHGAGIAGAPKAGDHTAWAPRIAKGKAMLYDHAIKGFNGTAGVMPAKGGRTDIADDLIKSAVDHMVAM